MNNLLKTGLTLLILGICFVVISPLLLLSGVYSFNSGLAIIGGLLMWIGIPCIPIGIILAIVGAIISPKEVYIHNYPYQYQQPQSVQQQPVLKEFFCPNCGTKLNGSPSFCFKCGYKLR